METLQTIQSTETINIVSSNSLPAEDKNYCDTLFTNYSNHIAHVSELLNTIETKDEEFKDKHTTEEEEQFFSVSKIDKATEALRDTIENLTQSLILKLENYFTKKYCLVFKSWIPDRGTINLNPFTSYDSIIQNITNQVGGDLLQAGKEQIKNRFLKSFYRNSLPTIKGNKISVPEFISLDENFGDRISLYYSHNARLENLINALNLFLNNSTELPEVITNKLTEWKRSLDLSAHYTVFPDVSFKFFKNRRLDVLFSNPTTALKFWNYYTLEIIEKIIKEND
jgi:hypothetical protein